MKSKVIFFAGLPVLSISIFLGCATLTARAQCPDLNKQETAQDCPWAEASRAIEGITDFTQLKQILEQKTPGFLSQIERDAKSPELLALWGLSNNFDVSAPTLNTIPTNLVNLLSKMLSVPYLADFSAGHAGLNHTYGYLFSTLATPYGYKRARYVQGEIEAGFGLPPDFFSGHSEKGTLLSNFTHFIGNLAFWDHPESQKKLKRIFESSSLSALPEIVYYPFSNLHPRRLVETVVTSNYFLELRTDIVSFNHENPKGSDKALLIYSIDLHEIGKPKNPLLITAFPVAQSFGDAVFNPLTLGEHQIIKLKYNATLPVTIPDQEMVGKRTISYESASN